MQGAQILEGALLKESTQGEGVKRSHKDGEVIAVSKRGGKEGLREGCTLRVAALGSHTINAQSRQHAALQQRGRPGGTAHPPTGSAGRRYSKLRASKKRATGAVGWMQKRGPTQRCAGLLLLCCPGCPGMLWQ